jgi:hypothetical protein
MMKNLFLILVVSVFGNFANAQGYISLQCPTPTSYCDTSAANCDSMLNMAFYNVALPSVPSGDLNFVCNNSVSGGYSMTLSINWGDGTTTFHQGTGSTTGLGMLASITPAANHLYQNAGSYPIVITYSINGAANSIINYTYNHVQCGTQYLPTTGSNSVACGVNTMIFDAGGNWGNYENNSNGYTVLNSTGSSQIHINGAYTQLETNYDTLKIFSGIGTSGPLLYTYNGSSGGIITPFTSSPGQPLTIQLKSDATVQGSGFAIQAVYSGTCANTVNSFFAQAQIDCNGDGIIDSLISIGIPLTIYNSTNTYYGMTNNGSFQLNNMAAGIYNVTVLPNWLASYGYVLNGITPSIVNINSGGAYTFFISLGCESTSSAQCVSGQVFCDMNNDGLMNSGESPIANATINILYNGMNFVTYTNGSGNYSYTYTGTTADSLEVWVNTNWMSATGYTSSAPIFQSVTSLGCNVGAPPTPVNFGLNCTSNLPTNCYAGYVFCDLNNNGVMNVGEYPIPFAPVYLGTATSGNTNITVYTDSTGYFSYCGQFNSSNTVTAWLNTQWLGYQGYTALNTVLTLQGSSFANPVPGYFAVNCGGTSCSDLWTTVTPWIGYYQNSTAYIRLNWGNYGPSAPGSYQLTFTYPAGVTPISSSIQNAGYSIIGNTITWTLNSSMTSFSSNDVIMFNVPSGLPSGTQHYYTSTITPLGQSDCSNVNNNGTLLQILGNSYDPNIKTVLRSEMYQTSPFSVAYLDANVIDDLVYTICFQNTGTAPAQNIYILDTLSSYLDWSTFNLIESTHPMQVVNLGNGQMRFEFPQIWLPDSTSNEPESHGHLVYRIRENSGCIPGTEIENTAHIFFDWNEAIVTNTTYNINEMFEGVDENYKSNIMVYPNPTANTLNVKAEGAFDYRLLDMDGRIVLNGKGTNTAQLQMESLKSGLYMLSVNGEFGTNTIRVTKVN